VDKAFKLITTEDGSNSIFVPSLDETYHSTFGAVTESQYVFIQEGLNFFLDTYFHTEVRVLEVGFGTGLNALLTLKFAEQWNCQVHYTTLEPVPLDNNLIDQLNFCKNQLLLGKEEHFKQIHSCNWEVLNKISSNFSLTKKNVCLQDFQSEQQYELIYFDAFAPTKQPEIWDIDVLEQTCDLLSERGILVTYCASRQFRRNLLSLGLEVEVLKGPPGKLEMVRAIKH